MNRNELLEGMDIRKALFGLFFAFANRLQAAGDSFYEEITCKQFFLLACLSLFPEEPPTLNDLANVMGSSHQNVKQIAGKLEKSGYVVMAGDEADRRKIRVQAAEKVKCLEEKYRTAGDLFMEELFAGVTEGELQSTFAVLSRIEQNLMDRKEKMNEKYRDL